MTAETAPAGTVTSRSVGELITSIPFRPAEGWLSLIATAVMVGIVAGSYIDAGWAGGPAADSGFLPYVGLVGLAFGLLGAKVGWGRWRTHVVGALFAGILLPLVVGGVIDHAAGWDLAGLGQRYAAMYEVVRNVWLDLVVFGRPNTNQIAHYHLVFGVMIWGAGQLAGFSVFGHRRPLDVVVVLGLLLIGDDALTAHNQLALLIGFSAAALLLLIRTHVFEEEVTWARRKIGDPAAVSQLYLGGGATFVTAAILGALLLTFTASSAPLQGAMQDFPRYLQSLSSWIQRFAPAGGDPVGLGVVTFGNDAVTTGRWLPSDRVAFRAQFAPTETEPFKWRAGTYAEYTTFGWKWGSTRTESTPAGGPLLAADGNGDLAQADGRREITFQVRHDAFIGATVIAPDMIESVDRDTDALVLGTNGWFATVESIDSSRLYNVKALVPVFEAKAGGISEPMLRTAGTDYPTEIRTLYLQLPNGALGTASEALLKAIQAEVVAPGYADPTNPYDLARTMEAYLRNADHFKYQANVVTERNAQCGGMSTVECFATIKVGYCDYYASTMAILLRKAGVPARVAYGFLPGRRGLDGLEEVNAQLAHYWVEVYFPGVGWIQFDPTGGGVGAPQVIPSGSPVAATPRPSGARATFRNSTGAPPSLPTGGGTTSGGTGVAPFIAITFILLIGLAALVFAAIRRTPNRPMHPDQAWGSVARLAARFGLGPRPSQTVYEYAGSLGDAVPAARIELTTIARAKVEVAYGKRDLGSDRLRNVAIAYQRLRFALLGVILRRGFRRRPKRR